MTVFCAILPGAETERSAAMRISSDLRKRVIDFVKAGGPKAAAARRFGVGVASVHRWCKAPDPLAYSKPGPKKGWRLDRAALAQHIADRPDATYAERARHFGVSRGAIWWGIKQLRVTRKKNGPLSGI